MGSRDGGAVERDSLDVIDERRRVDTGGVQAGPHRVDLVPQVDPQTLIAGCLATGTGELRNWRHAMIAGERDHDGVGVSQLVKRVEKPAERLVESDLVLMRFARIWSIGMPDHVGRRERHGENVRLGPASHTGLP